MSEIEDLRNKITELVDNIKTHSDRFTGKPHLPTLELNVFLAKLNRLYETTVVLRHLMDKEEMKTIKNHLSETASPHQTEPKELLQYTFQTTDTDTTIKETDDAVRTVAETPSEPISEKEVTPKHQNKEQPKSEIKESVVDTLNNQPISNLTQALSLNEKYLFANEFFNKDLNAFLLMVKQINEAGSLDEALQIFDTSVTNKTVLNDENELTSQFKQLIIRRFL